LSLFEFKAHSKFPEMYDACQSTGVLKFKPAVYRDYGDSYFMEEYKNQYKKTYYDDEINLRQMAVRRLSVVSSIYSGSVLGKSLLEIGSAAGFFLSEAKQMGFETKGYELSPREVEYSRNKLSLDVDCESILNIKTDVYQNQVDVICAFFVLEHIQEIDALWERIASWIKKHGILFLAVPSFFGPTFQTNPSNWFETHPQDHFYDYDPSSLKKLLSILGFDLRYARPMSYHRKRDLGLLGRLPDWAYKLYSNQSCYGDTIELAFQKTKH
jgi:2-polyprenyl-3-methyl-5-hydroxy-6-metoxy-1,4-benzoquinol methylase